MIKYSSGLSSGFKISKTEVEEYSDRKREQQQQPTPFLGTYCVEFILTHGKIHNFLSESDFSFSFFSTLRNILSNKERKKNKK